MTAQHFRPVALGHQQQRFHRDLPIGVIMLGFRQRGDVFGGVAQRQQLAPVGQNDRVKELALRYPVRRHHPLIAPVPSNPRRAEATPLYQCRRLPFSR